MKAGMASLLVASILLGSPLRLIADDCAPVFNSIKHNRSLPHSYVDQGMTSIPSLYPKHKLLLERRYSMVGPVEYSLLVYQEDGTKDTVTIEGAAVRFPQAWTFQAKCQNEKVLECLVLTLEKVSALGETRHGNQ